MILRNLPRIRDTEAQIELLERLGVKTEWLNAHDLQLQADALGSTDVDEDLAARIRASFLLAGPLLARFGKVPMPPPGGDTIGRRRLDPHLDAFRDLGAVVERQPDDRDHRSRRPQRLRDLHGRALGDGHRERADRRRPDRGPTTIANAACEPHVQDLARLLAKMGATSTGSART